MGGKDVTQDTGVWADAVGQGDVVQPDGGTGRGPRCTLMPGQWAGLPASKGQT